MTAIEMQSSAKALLKTAQKLVEDGSPWSEELQKAINSLTLSVSISVREYQFAQRVLEATVQDARI